MEEAFKAFQQTLVERFSSPLLSSFLIAWAGWNYKFVMIVLSSNTVTTTLDLIQRLAFPDWQTIVVRGAVLPLVSALLYILGYPYPARWVNGFVLRQQKANNQQRSKIEEETPLTLEESNLLRAEFRARYREQEEGLRKAEGEAAHYREIANSADARESKLKADRDALSSNVDQYALRMAEADRSINELKSSSDALVAELNVEVRALKEEWLHDSKSAQRVVDVLTTPMSEGMNSKVVALKLNMEPSLVNRLVQLMHDVGYLNLVGGRYSLTQKGQIAFGDPRRI